MISSLKVLLIHPKTHILRGTVDLRNGPMQLKPGNCDRQLNK